MNLFLLRHGLAVERGRPGFTEDADRPLTPKGRRQLRTIARTIRKLDLNLDLILSSPLTRAKQSAEIIAAGLKLKQHLKYSASLAPGGDPAVLFRGLDRLKPAPKNLLLVGHEPDLSRLISVLTTGGTQLRLDLKKGGLCRLKVGRLELGQCATLEWLLSPKQLKRLG